MMPNRKPLIEKLEQQSPLNFRVDFRKAIVIACIPADIFQVGKSARQYVSKERPIKKVTQVTFCKFRIGIPSNL